MSKHGDQTKRARSLRRAETKSEKLLWSLLRDKQVCGLKFRRQHPIGPFFADFACVSRKLVVEIDGGYHDAIGENDLRREASIQREGWSFIRFSDLDVEQDPEAVAMGIAKHLGLHYEFQKRSGTGSGMDSVKSPSRRQPSRPSPAATASDPPGGRVS